MKSKGSVWVVLAGHSCSRRISRKDQVIKGLRVIVPIEVLHFLISFGKYVGRSVQHIKISTDAD